MSASDTNDPPANDEATAAQSEKPTVLNAIRGLQSGTILSRSLSKDDRRACVRHLSDEGCLVVQIAEILKCCERTIYRDREAIYEANAIECDPMLAAKIVGRLLREADLSIAHLRRAARDKKAPTAVQVDAAYRAYQVFSDLVQRLQGLGYLPTAAHEIRADLTHHVADIPDLPEIQAEIDRLMLNSPETADGQIPAELLELKRKAEVASLAIEVEAVSSTLSDKEVRHEESE